MDNKRIGFYYASYRNWIGGRYYLDTILNVLKSNPNNELFFIKVSFFAKVIFKLSGYESRIIKSIYKQKSKKLKFDVIFPYYYNAYGGKRNIAWIPDFQENYYPEFFTTKEITLRLQKQVQIAYSNATLIVSSESSKMDFERLYPKHTCSVEVLPFISSLYGKEIKETESVLNKYNIKRPFFICSNQLWKHKNHIVVIKAIKELKDKGISVFCVFTGKEYDYRDPNYPSKLKQIVKNYGLENEIFFLGFIPRNDQIVLMKKSIAVIQPSLFEGWNTTIEDAKVYNKLVIASSLSVHKEQLKDKGLFFDVDDYQTLSKILLKIYESEIQVIDYEYGIQVNDFKKRIEFIFFQ